MVGIRGDVTVQPHDAVPAAPAWSGNGRPPVPRYRQPPVPVAELAAAAGRDAFGEVTWREGSRGPMTSRFLAVQVRPAGVRSRRLAQAATVAEHGQWDGVLPEAWLRAEWPAGDSKPTRFWLSDLPEDTPIAELVRLAKIRWRIEHDYRELKHGLGLDHFEGGSWNGWHHRHPGHRRPRLPHRAALVPKSRHTGLSLYQILDAIQDLLNCWTGTCTICHRPLPQTRRQTTRSTLT